MSRYEEINERVARLLVETLNVDEEEIKPAATLQGDLGAESIDFLDLVFRLESEFGIDIPGGELFPESVFRKDSQLVQDGCVTEKGMVELRSRMPYLDLGALDRGRRLGAVSDLFTVGLVSRYVDWKLGQCAGGGASDGEARSAAACSVNAGEKGGQSW
jgi:acyl carrier protein